MNEPILPETVAIAVVPRDRLSMFPQCLEALYEHTNVPFLVVVTVGAADELTTQYLNRLQAEKDNLKVVFMDRLLMQGEARNVALRQVDERFCVVLENDTIVHENWLPPLMECLREEQAAAVTPLIFWHRGIHAAGCMFEEREEEDAVKFNHKILYTGICRKQIDYPENHCILLDRRLIPDGDIFDDVEPFDVDLGLTLRKHGRSVYFEPRSTVTYSAPPVWEIYDVPIFKFRWDAAAWESRNRRFMRKWNITYNPAAKIASYRRQQMKLGFARWYPNKITIRAANVSVKLANYLYSLITLRHR